MPTFVQVGVFLSGLLLAPLGAADEPGADAARPAASLAYYRRAGAEHCPDEAWLRRSVAQRLSRDPFGPAASQHFQVELTLTEGRLGHIALAGAEAQPPTRREFESSADCAELVDAVALAINLAINPDLAVAETSTERPAGPADAARPMPTPGAFGDGTLLPLATEPDVLYPPADRWHPFGSGGAPAQYLSPVDGFSYTITDSGVRLPTLRLEATLTESWQSFCELHTPVRASQSAGYTCSYSEALCNSGAPQPVNLAFRCGACAPTAPVCTCDATACGVPRASKQPLDLTLSDDGQTLRGPFSTDYRDDPRWSHMSGYSLHLTRVVE